VDLEPWGPEFRKRDLPMSWFGTTEERLPDYAARMKAAYGDQQAREIMVDGTPHVMIFPNLFIAEIQMFVIQPLAVDDSVQQSLRCNQGGSGHEPALASADHGFGWSGRVSACDDSEMYERCHDAVA
jgi:fatty-acyl-CoA synthase